MRRTGKCAFHASAQSASSNDARLELADGPQVERLQVAQRRVASLDGRSAAARSLAGT